MSDLPDLSQPVSAIWQQITRIPRPAREVAFPRIDPATGEPVGRILMWVLTQEEIQGCAAEAERNARKALKDLHPKKDDQALGYENLYHNEVSVQILYRACRDLDEPKIKAVFPSPKLLRNQLTQDEIGVLIREYLTVQAELGPVVSQMSAEEVDAYVKRLVEAGNAVPLAFLSSETLNDLVMHLVYRLYPSMTDTSSPGEQHEDGSSGLSE